MGGDWTGHACARARYCRQAKQPNSSAEFFSPLFAPRAGPHGQAAWFDPPALTPRGAWTDAPLLAGAKDRSLSYRAADFPNCAATKRIPTPCTRNGSHLREAHLLAVLGRKNQHCATHAAPEKFLTGSTATPSNFQTATNVQPFSAPNERKRANVKCV